MTPAGKLQAYLKQKVQGSGGQYRKVRWEGRNGCPDCFVWWDWPCAAFVEIKAETETYKDKHSAVQAREVERMQRSGLPVYTARNTADIDYIVNRVKKDVASGDCMC